MNDHLARAFCPTCEPDVDEFRECVVVRWCGRHAPSERGLDDAGVTVEMLGIGAGEAAAVDCRAVQALIRSVLLALALVVALAACATKAQVVTIPVGSFAYSLGEFSARVDAVCARKTKLAESDCEYFTKVRDKAKAALDAPAPPIDWAEVLKAMMSLAAKAAL